MSKLYATQNWGTTLPSMLSKEDIEERPKPFDIASREIDPPNWAIKASSKIGGKRHSKREIVCTPLYSVRNTAIISAPAVHGPLAEQDAVKKALSRRERRKGRADTPSAKKQVPKGNLREEDYRFWKGYPTQDEGAQCRWCSSIYKGRQNMTEHHRLAPCKDYLMALFRYAKQMAAQRYCFSCKKMTTGFRWGIPLCSSVECLANWKFTISDRLSGFLQYRIWADDAHDHDPKNGPYKDIITESFGRYLC